MIQRYNDKNKLAKKFFQYLSCKAEINELLKYTNRHSVLFCEGQRLPIFNCESPCQDTSLGGLISGDTALSQLSTMPRETLQKVLASSHQDLFEFGGSQKGIFVLASKQTNVDGAVLVPPTLLSLALQQLTSSISTEHQADYFRSHRDHILQIRGLSTIQCSSIRHIKRRNANNNTRGRNLNTDCRVVE